MLFVYKVHDILNENGFDERLERLGHVPICCAYIYMVCLMRPLPFQ